MTSFYRRHGKRLLDLALTLPALIPPAPAMGFVALTVWVTMGRTLPLLPAAFAAMHFVYGLGFLIGLVRFRRFWSCDCAGLLSRFRWTPRLADKQYLVLPVYLHTPRTDWHPFQRPNWGSFLTCEEEQDQT